MCGNIEIVYNLKSFRVAVRQGELETDVENFAAVKLGIVQLLPMLRWERDKATQHAGPWVSARNCY